MPTKSYLYVIDIRFFGGRYIDQFTITRNKLSTTFCDNVSQILNTNAKKYIYSMYSMCIVYIVAYSRLQHTV